MPLPLAGSRWFWQGNLDASTTDNDHGLTARYGLDFKHNGWFEFLADCKKGVGIYEVQGQQIALAVIQTKSAGCGKSSHADDFIAALEAARSYSKEGGKLFLELRRVAKIMVFGSTRPDGQGFEP